MTPTDIAALIVIHDWLFKQGSGPQVEIIRRRIDEGIDKYVCDRQGNKQKIKT